MTDSELTANLYSFLLAGHETSAVALGWSLWLLAKDPAAAAKRTDDDAPIFQAEPDEPELESKTKS